MAFWLVSNPTGQLQITPGNRRVAPKRSQFKLKETRGSAYWKVRDETGSFRPPNRRWG